MKGSKGGVIIILFIVIMFILLCLLVIIKQYANVKTLQREQICYVDVVNVDEPTIINLVGGGFIVLAIRRKRR